MRRKKNFTLVEVVVALAIFSLCALPLVRQPFILSENNYNSLYQSELFRHAGVTHCTLLSQLYTRDIPWDSLPKSCKQKYILASTPCCIVLEKNIERPFIQKVTMHHKKSKKISNEQTAHLLEIIISYLPKGKKKSKKQEVNFSYLFTAIGQNIPDVIPIDEKFY
jgi:prepilin-type N-terminal cleavage/methylation domain-containing protein